MVVVVVVVVDHDALDSQPRSLKGSDPYGYVLICVHTNGIMATERVKTSDIF